MTEISIDTNVPPPTGQTRKDPLYPWLSMRVGDSFVVHGRTAAAAARGSFQRYQKMGKIPPELTVSQRTEFNYTGLTVRLWLVEKEK
jgi:hypothetical protein